MGEVYNRKYFPNSFIENPEKDMKSFENFIIWILDRIEKMEKMLDIHYEQTDRNEFDSLTDNRYPTMITVSPSNFKKLGDAKIGDKIYISCTNDESVQYILKMEGFVTHPNKKNEEKADIRTKKADIKSKKADIQPKKSNRKRRKKNKNPITPNSISTRKISFCDSDKDVGKREREKAIAKGLIIPADDDENESHHWKPKSGMNRSYI